MAALFLRAAAGLAVRAGAAGACVVAGRCARGGSARVCGGLDGGRCRVLAVVARGGKQNNKRREE